jgi:hypothetical protein
MDKAKIMRQAWKRFRAYGDHKTHSFSKCLRESWSEAKGFVVPFPKVLRFRDTVTLPQVRAKGFPLYSWEMKNRTLAVVNLQAYEGLSIDDGMKRARTLREMQGNSDARGYKNSSIYKAYQETRGVQTFISRTNRMTVERNVQGSISPKQWARRFGDTATY